MKILNFTLLIILFISIACSTDSTEGLLHKKSIRNTPLSEHIDILTDSIKVIKYKEFQLLFTQFNKEFNLWYSPKLIVNNDILLISGMSNENGSELSINKSPNSNFFIMDNIIKGYVEDGNGEKILHENFICIIVNVKEAKVEQSLQSECDGTWNNQNEWVSSGSVIFNPK